jgi:proteasome alpha subunit
MMRSKTQTHRMIYDETESVESVAREISEEMQQATQYGGIRPYAISLLVGGIDTMPRLYEVEPGASFLGYKADAIGSGRKIAQEVLLKEYKDDMDIDDAISLGVKIIKKVAENGLSCGAECLDVATIEKKKGYVALTQDKIKKYL